MTPSLHGYIRVTILITSILVILLWPYETGCGYFVELWSKLWQALLLYQQSSRLLIAYIFPRHLKPGGWIELQEIHHCPRSALMDADVPTDHPVAQFWSNVTDGLTALGVDFNASSGGKLANMMQQAGFTNVTERIFHVPIGTWPKNKVLKTVGLYWRTILLDGLQAIALGPLTRGLQWNREQVELFLMNVRQAYYDNAARMYMPLHIIYAQKPLHDY